MRKMAIACIVVLSSLICTTSSPVLAAGYPERPVRFIVPAAAGGGADVIVRLITGELTRQLGKQFIVDNRPGGGGSIGTELIARAAADGYTIGNGSFTTLVINRFVLPKQPYDTERDFQPVARHVVTPNILAVTLSLPVKSVQELIDHARKHPSKLLYVSSGNGSTLHLAGELFKRMTHTHITHIPYKGAQQGITDMIGGQVQLMLDNASSIGTHVRGGRVRALAITSAMRSTSYPELPTVAESGVPKFEVVAWGGVIAPSGVPKDIITRLNMEINKALASAGLKEKTDVLGNTIVTSTPEEFSTFIKRELVKWGEVIKAANIKLD